MKADGWKYRLISLHHICQIGPGKQGKSQSRFASAETKISRFVSLQEFHIERVYWPCAGGGMAVLLQSHLGGRISLKHNFTRLTSYQFISSSTLPSSCLVSDSQSIITVVCKMNVYYVTPSSMWSITDTCVP